MRWLRLKITLIAFWGILSFLPALELEAARVQLVIVGDTLDKDIGTDVQSDINILASQMMQMGGGYLMPPIIVKDKDCNRQKIRSSLNNLKLQRDDTVFFYYSGHGAYDRARGQHLQIPRLGLEKDIPRNEIRDQIKGWVDGKKIRLGIVITDMCNLRQVINVYVPKSQAPAMAAPAQPQQKPQLWKALFLDSSGFVDVNSASKDEVAANFPKKYDQNGEDVSKRGSIFLSAFSNQLHRNIYNRLSWDTLLTEHISPLVKSRFSHYYPEGIPVSQNGTIQLTQTVQIDSFASLTGGPEFIDRGAQPVAHFDLDDHLKLLDGLRIRSINTIISRSPVMVQARDGLRQGVRILAIIDNPELAKSWKPGDVILSVGGQVTPTPAWFASVIAHSPDSTIAAWVKFSNNFNERGRPVVLRNGNAQLNFGNNPPVDQTRPKLGVVPDLDVYSVQTPNGAELGIRISQVLANTPAYGILDPGDIIIKINNQPTPNEAAFRKAIADAGDTIQIYGWDSRTGDVKDFQPIPLNK